MKRTWIVFLSSLLLNASTAQAQLTWITNADNTLTITGYSGPPWAVSIPSTINGSSVASIGDFAFFYSPLTSVAIPGSVTNIGNDAFYGCNNLTDVNIPDSVISLGNEAFMQCGLTSVTIGSGVTNIGDFAFCWCFSLPAITVSVNNSAYVGVAGVLFNRGETALISYPAGIVGSSYVIPSTVTTIADGAFFQCTGLTSVTIPNAVTSIGEDAFYLCRILSNVTIPDKIATIGSEAFGSTALTSVTIPNTATNIGDGAFAACSSLPAISVNPGNPNYVGVAGVLFNRSKDELIQYPAGNKGSSYVIPSGVASIGGSAFEDSASLASITIPNGVTNIGDSAFDGCTSLTSITMPNSVISIADYAFDNCDSLTAVYFQGNAPAADSTVFDNDGDVTAYYFEGTTGWGSTFAGVPTVELPATAVSFTATPTSGALPLVVSFASAGADSAGHAISAWSWAFGDASISTAQNPSHTYTKAGTFSPILIATNNIGGTVIGSGPALITVSSAAAHLGLVLNGGFETGDFTGWTQSGNTNYTSVTTGSTYAYSGAYGAQLGPGGSPGYLSQTLATTAGATYSLSLSLNSFDGQPTNEFLVSWSGNTLFDETNISAIGWTNLQFLASATGANTVLEFGFRDDTSYLGLDQISVVPASGVAFSANPTNGIAPLSVQFKSPDIDSGGNAITNWNWTFGDGSTSGAQNPSHVYNNSGTFQPSFIATNSLGSAVYGSGPVIGVTVPFLSVAIQPTNNPLTVAAGITVTLFASVTGTGPFLYQWQLNGTNYPISVITTAAGNGTQGYSGDDGAATNAKLNFPWSVAVDASGNLFIADVDNNRVRKVGANGIITTVAGNGTSGYSGDGGAATNAELSGPYGVAVDGSGNLFIADFGNERIRKVATSGIITTVAGNGNAGYFGDGGAATNCEFYYPRGVSVDASGNLFIADEGNNRIRKLDTNGIITTVAGNGLKGYSGDGGAATNAELDNIFDVSAGNSGNLFIADLFNDRIRNVAANGIITTVAGNGTAGFSGDEGVATNAELYNPEGVTVDAFGNLFIADFYNARVRKVGTNGIITTLAGNGTSGYSGDGGAATNAELAGPEEIAADNFGNIFIADPFNDRIREVTAQGPTLVLNDIGAGNAGAYDVVVSSPYGSVTSSVVNLMIRPASIGQTLFVGDNNGDILEFSPDGAQSTFASGLSTVWGLAFDRVGDLFASDLSGHIYEFTPGGVKSNFASGLDNPAGLAFNSTGDLFVAEYGTGNIYEYTPSGARSTFAFGEGAYGLAFNSTGDLFDATALSSFPDIYEFTPSGGQGTFASGVSGGPSYLAFNSTGDLFVADQDGGNIFEFTPSGVRSTFASGLSSPQGLVFNAAGDLFVADGGNIYEYTPSGARSIFASGLDGFGMAFQVVGSSMPPTITSPPISQTNIVGNSVTFTVAATGTAPISYHWLFNNTNLTNNAQISGSQSDTLTLTNITMGSAGAYEVIVSNSSGATNAFATLTVKQATPTISWASPASIAYGTALSSNQLNATANVPGTFAYTPTNGAVLNAGTNLLSVIFTPTDRADYSSVTNSVSLVVLRVPLIVTAANTNRPYGQANPVFTGAIAGLANNDNITATYSCPTTISTSVGRYAITPTLVDPVDRQTNYTVTLVSGALTITQAVPVLTWSTPIAITYGTALSAKQLNATANVPGNFAYTPTNGTVLNAGTNLLSVIFTPTDRADYSSVTNSVSLVVLRVPLIVTAANTNRPYGQANPVFTGVIVGLTNNDNITATYSCPATISTPVGTDAITPSLVDPDDRQTNYTVTLVNGTLTITQAVPVMTWINPATIAYGTALTTNQLNATANVPGSFAYTPTNGTVLNAGTNDLSVIFTPTSTTDYANVTNTVSLVVSHVPLTVSAANTNRAHGQANPVFTGAIVGLTNNDNITATYSCSAASGSPAGTYAIAPALVDPSDRQTNYTVTLVNGTLTITNGPLPDLQVVSVAIPAQAWTGRSFDATWVLTNTGTAAAIGPWFDRVYLSVTNQLQTNVDQVLGNFIFEEQLQPGESVQLTQPVVINATGITNGRYYVSVLADASNNVLEIAKTNNNGTSTLNTFVQVTPLAKLTVTSVDAPANAVGGQPVGVSWIVCNQGQADTDVPIWHDHLYLSTTTNLTGVIEDYGLYENPSYLAVNDCYEQDTIVVLPIGVSRPCYFIVDADAAGVEGKDNITNTFGSTTLPMNIQLVTPGFLHTVSVEVAPAPPTVTWPGAQVICTYIVQNIGQSPITGSWDDRITLSSVSNYVNGVTTGFVYENDIGGNGPLAPGASYTNSVPFALPQTVDGVNITGTWYVAPVVDIHLEAGGAGFDAGNVGRDELAAPIDVTTPPPADLVTTSVLAPTNVVEGGAINVVWTVVNEGNNQTSSAYWHDGIYISTNKIFNSNQSTLIGTYGHFGTLGLTSSYAQSESITVPANLLPGKAPFAAYYLFVDADAGNSVFELDKTNNVLGAPSPITVLQAPPPGQAVLSVTSVSAPGTIPAGGPVDVTWTVTNSGTATTIPTSWVDSVYLSPDGTFNPKQDRWLANVPHNGVLAPGGSYTVAQSLNTPYCVTGSYFIVVITDSGYQVNGVGTLGNNMMASPSPMLILPNDAARLNVSAVSSASSVVAGAPLAVSWTVTNLGNATTNASWVDGVFLSPSPVYVPGAGYLLGLYTSQSNLTAGGSYSPSGDYRVPRCASGTYYVAVVTDLSNAVDSISCDTNNVLVSPSPVEIAPSAYPSLQIAGLTVPTNITSGVPWTVQWSVTNAGTGAASGTWFDAVYASLDPTLETNAILLGEFEHAGGLATGGAYSQNQLLEIPPCTAGKYYIIAATDISNTVNISSCQLINSVRFSGIQTVNAGLKPDLVVSAISNPPAAKAGQPMTISWTVTNGGLAPANSPWVDAVYLSPDDSFNPANGILLGDSAETSPLPPGASRTQTASFTLPQIYGSYYVAVFTDATNAIQECQNEANNVAVSATAVNISLTIYPDLHVTSVQIPGAALAGQPITVTWVVTNDGTGPTRGATWNDAVYLSLDEVLDPSDARLGTFPNVSSLGVGQSYTNSTTFVLPPGDAGPFYILVLADSGDALYEHLGYNDSLGWNPDAMLVTLPPPVDLAANNISVSPSSGFPGTQTTIAWTVSNVGTNNTASAWTDAIYLSTNNFWDITATLLTDVNHTGLAAKSSYTGSWAGPLPALSPGSYHAILWTDVRNTVPELNLSNNVVVSATTITSDVPILTLGQPVTNQLTTGSAQYYKINLAPGQTVQFNLTGASLSSDNQLFVRYGAIPDLGDYDFIYSNPLSPNQQVVIPATQKGWYYVMVRGENEPGGPLAYTLKANTIPFAITSVSQNHIGDNGQVTITLTGAQFQPGATVELVSGTNSYFSQTNFFNDATSIGARFMFTNAVHGVYGVALTNPNNQSTTAAEAVIIETAIPLTGQVIPGLVNKHPRVGLPFEWNGAVVNVGNVDIQYVTVVVDMSQPFPISLNPPLGAIFADTNSTDNPANVCTFVARNLEPSGSLDFSFLVSGFGSQGFLYNISPTLQTTSDFLKQVKSEAESTREFMISSPNALTLTTTNASGVIITNSQVFPPPLAALLATATTWEGYYTQALVAGNVLDSNDVTFLVPQSRSAITAIASQEALANDSSCQSACMVAHNVGVQAARAAWILECGQCALACDPTLVFGPEGWLVCYAACTSLALQRELFLDSALETAYKACLLGCPPNPQPCSGNPNSVCPPSPNDPNEMQGPNGYSTTAFVGSQIPWQYTVYFENDSNALAFARQISITNYLGPDFDIRTFRLSEIDFGSVSIPIPTNRSFYQTRVPAPYPNPSNIVVDVTADVDVQHGLIFCTLNAIDLNTGQLVVNANEGVLPPDTTNSIGLGRLVYTIQPLASVPTGAVITNEASIIFDNNDPIETNPTTNTVDAVPPTSVIGALTSPTLDTNILVTWSGTDDSGGSGVQGFDIYVSDNAGPWQLWVSDVSSNSATYSGQPGHTYDFESLAHDNAGNIELGPLMSKASVYISDNQSPVLTPIPNQTVAVGQTLVLTNSASNANGSSNGLSFSLVNSPQGAAVNATSGKFAWSPPASQAGSTNLVTVEVANSGIPPLTAEQSFVIVVPAISPLAMTFSASDVTASNATLNASVTPNGAPASVYFQWGATTNYGNFTVTNILSADLNKAHAESAHIGNLLPGTTNHFEIVASNSAGTSYGGDLAIVTPQIGSLQVTIMPTNAVKAGAQWQVDDGEWETSGAVVSGLSAGTNHTVAFKLIYGWSTPSNEIAVITGGTTSRETGIYTPQMVRDVALAITSPSPGQKLNLTNNGFSVTGSAKEALPSTDNVVIESVYYQLNASNGGSWLLAMPGSSWSNWTARVDLIPGANIFSAYALDTSNNTSPIRQVAFDYIPSGTLAVRTNGFGSITPVYNGKLLSIGGNYALTATAGQNWVFSNWIAAGSESFVSNNSILRFSMQSNLTLTANFVTNIFLAAQGTYNGLFAPSDVARQQTNSGAITFSVTSAGVLSGKLIIGAASFSLKGQFDLAGAVAITIPRKDMSSLIITLQLDFAGQSVSGIISDGNFVAEVNGDRDVFSSVKPATEFEGRYTLIILGTNDSNIGPFGTSYGTVTISPAGTITLTGSLADGTSVSQSSVVSKDGLWPLYVNLYGGKGSLWGWNYFTNGGIVSSNASWISASNSLRTALYRTGFTNLTVSVIGSAYNPEAEPSLDLPAGEIVLEGGDVPAITNLFVLKSNGTLLLTNIADTNKLTLTINKTTGAVTGSFVNPINSKDIIKIAGVLLQNQTNGQGYFLGSNGSGIFLLQSR